MQPPDHRDELEHLRLGEPAGDLVEEEQARVGAERAGELQPLALQQAEPTGRGVGEGRQSGPLERYERWRRFDSAFSATVMDGLNRLFSNDNAPLRALRDLGLGVVDRAPWLKRVLVREAAGVSGTVPRLLKGERL